jgi:hypothetical protein
VSWPTQFATVTVTGLLRASVAATAFRTTPPAWLWHCTNAGCKKFLKILSAPIGELIHLYPTDMSIR